MVTFDDIVKTMANCFIAAELPAFTIRNLETHLEDINILNDKEQESDIPTYLTMESNRVNDVLNKFADAMAHLGFEISFNILNSLRFRFKEKDELESHISVNDWLVIVRRVVGTVNTTLRNRGIVLDV